MSRTKTFDALILKSYDVGEADRFLVLFTKEEGRITARARGVRKLHSKLRGHLLPFQRSEVMCTESSSGFLVTGALSKDTDPVKIESFMLAERCTEYLLCLLHDHEPLPEAFEITQNFFVACQKNVPSILPYTIKLLVHLGLLPDREFSNAFGTLSPEAERFLSECLKGDITLEPTLPLTELSKISETCNRIIEEQGHKKLQTEQFALFG